MSDGADMLWLIGVVMGPLVLASILHGSGRPGLARVVVILAIALWIRLLWPMMAPQAPVPAAPAVSPTGGDYGRSAPPR